MYSQQKNSPIEQRTSSKAESGLCRREADFPDSLWQYQSQNIIDLLRTAPSQLSFAKRVQALGLSVELEEKILLEDVKIASHKMAVQRHLLVNDEKELATEVLLYRHKFTTLVFNNKTFRQAALTIIQNIYLFHHRKIFFGSNGLPAEQERQEALLLFSQSPGKVTIPLIKTFQHMILARVWDRIVSQADGQFLRSKPFMELHEVVERLNTLRNTYMLLTTGLVRKIISKINSIYRQSITSEDAGQIGSFGIARAAYRYHPSSGFRFSTYASQWILKEIQRQALEGRLIRISSNLLEQISRAARNQNKEEERSASRLLTNATALLAFQNDTSQLAITSSPSTSPAGFLEKKELRRILVRTIISTLSKKSGDVIMRRYGLGSYQGKEQSVIEISKAYGVTRGSIYQLEQSAMKKLKTHLSPLLR